MERMATWGRIVFLSCIISLISITQLFAHPDGDLDIAVIRAFDNPQASGDIAVPSAHQDQASADADNPTIDGNEYKPGEVLVKFTSTAVSAGEKFISSQAVEVLKARGQLGMDYLIKRKTLNPNSPLARWRVVTLPKGVSVKEALDLFSSDPSVEVAEPNAISQAKAIPNDALFDSLWGMKTIQAPLAWDTETGYRPIVVGVIDSGVDYTHEDLAMNMWTNPGEVPNNGVDDDGNGYIDDVYGYDFANDDGDPWDDGYHGTHVAGTIGAVGNNMIGVAGVNWDIQIMAIKFLDGKTGRGTLLGAVQAIDYATSMGVKLTNNSWGCACNYVALEDAISAANDAGMLFIASAGNSGKDITTSGAAVSPGGLQLPNIISVAATGSSGRLTYWSNYGREHVHLAAPGEGILSTFPKALCGQKASCKNTAYSGLSGTSMSAPHVTGAAALLWSAYPGLTAEEVKSWLLGGVDPVPALADKTITGGSLNVAKALANAASPVGFRVSLSPQFQELQSGDSTTVNVGVKVSDSHSGKFTLNAVAPNELMTISLAETELNLLPGERGGTSMAIATVVELPKGYYPIEVVATDELGNEDRRIVTYKVDGPSLSITYATDTPLIVAGDKAEFTLTLTSEQGFTGPINLSALSVTPTTAGLTSQITDLPDGMTVTFIPQALDIAAGETQLVTMTVNTTADTPAGKDYSILLAAEGQHVTWNPTIPLGIWKPGSDLVNVELWVDTSAPVNIGDSMANKFSIEERNLGIEVAPSHVSGIYLSTDDIIDTSDILIATVNIPAILGGGEIYHVHPNFHLPRDIEPGNYYIGSVVDIESSVTESDESNNVSETVPSLLTVTNSIDLEITEFVNSDSGQKRVAAGDLVSHNVTIRNNGSAPLKKTFYVKFYRSSDSYISKTDQYIGQKIFRSFSLFGRSPITLDAGERKTFEFSYTPGSHNTNDGENYYIGAFIDPSDNQAEFDETNNTAVTGPYETLHDIDLAPVDIQLSRTQVNRSEAIDLTATINNGGTTLANAVSVDFYLSTDTTITPTDIRLTTYTFSEIAAASSSTEQISVKTRAQLGKYYVGMIVNRNKSIKETNHNNNVYLGEMIEIIEGDVELAVSSVSYQQDFVNPGQYIVVNYTMESRGTVGVITPSAGLYLSNDDVKDSSDIYLRRDYPRKALSPGDSIDRAFRAYIPTDIELGNYYLIVDAMASLDSKRITSNKAGPVLGVGADFELSASDLTVNASGYTVGDSAVLSYTLLNAGTSTVPVVETSFYLSKDATYSSDDMYIAMSSIHNLAGSSSTTVSDFTFSIPYNIAAGDYYLIAKVDNDRRIPELDETNNIVVGAMVSIQNDVDLEVTSLIPSVESAVAGDSVMITSTIQNNGSTPMPPDYSVGIYLRPSTGRYSHHLGSWKPSASLAQGESETKELTVTMPTNTRYAMSRYSLIATADAGKIVNEVDEVNNTKRATFKLTEDRDLIITKVRADKNIIMPSENFTVDTTIVSNGPTPVYSSQYYYANYNVGLYLSTDEEITREDIYLDSWNPYPKVLVDGASASHTFYITMPDDFISGSYYVGAIVDVYSDRGETNENNNAMAGTKITIGDHDVDLTVSNVFADLAINDNISAGQNLTIRSTVSNAKGNVSAGHVVGLYLSIDQEIEQTDIYLGEWTTENALAGGEEESASISVMLPVSLEKGMYYVGAIADASDIVTEKSETNNATASGTPIAVIDDVDLSIVSVNSAQLDVLNGGEFTISSAVKNGGSASVAPGHIVGLYLSTDATIDGSDIYLGSWVSTALLESGAIEQQETTVTIPSMLPSGSYYFGAIADHGIFVAETKEGNNASPSAVAVNVISDIDVDLSMVEVSADDGVVATGETLTVTSSVTNVGATMVAAGHRVGLYLSEDADIDINDTYLGAWVTRKSLSNGGVESKTITVSVPAMTMEGDYYLGAIADYEGIVYEVSEDNNSLAAPSLITVKSESSVDLTISELSMSDTKITAANSFTVSSTVTNVGTNNVAAGHVVGIYLSTDDVIDGSDIPLGSWVTSLALFGGDSESRDITITAPSDLAPGDYYVGAIADVNNAVSESNEANNGTRINTTTNVEVCTIDGVEVDCVTNEPLTTNRAQLCPERTVEAIYGVYCDYQIPTLQFSAYRLEHAWGGAGFDAGTTFTQAFQINDVGDVIGSAVTSAGEQHAAMMKVGDGNFTNFYMYDLGQQGLTSNARTINNLMTFAGELQIDADHTNFQAGIWHTQVGYPAVLNALGDERSVATDLARDELYTEYVAGYGVWINEPGVSDGLEHGFVWSFDGANQSVTTIGAPGEANRATAINDDQYAVGYLIGETGAGQAYSSYLGNITQLPGAGGSESRALAINNNLAHKIVGYSKDLAGIKQAVVWKNSTIYTLPALTGAQSSSANAITDAGDIVGQSNNKAVFWRNGRIYDLNNVLNNNIGVTFTDALDVNRRGRVLVKADNGDYYILIPDRKPNQVAPKGVDLVVNSIETSSSSVDVGSDVVINTTITNRGGQGAESGIETKLYLSTDVVIDDSDIHIGSWLTDTAFGGRSSANRSIVVTLPETLKHGYYYLGAVADSDNIISETNETNNTFTGVTPFLVTSGIDLTVTDIVSNVTKVAKGGRFIVGATINNEGSIGVGAEQMVGLFLSKDSIIDNGDHYIGEWGTEVALAGGESTRQEVIATLPSSLNAGDYYLGAIADYKDSTTENDEANNSAVMAATIVITASGGVDLSISNLSSADKAISGDSLTANSTVINNGNEPVAAGHVTALYLSTDQYVDDADLVLGTWAASTEIAQGGSESNSMTVRVPATLSAGSYYVIAQADNDDMIGETDEVNNTAVGNTPVNIVKEVDLEIKSVNAGVSTVVSGDTLAINSSVENIGVSTTTLSHSVGLYLSSDSEIDTSDVYLGGWTATTQLAKNQNESKEVVGIVPPNLVAGEYYLGAIADVKGSVNETDEANNSGQVSQVINVTSSYDLSITSISSDLSEVFRGGRLALSSTVKNNGLSNVSSGYKVGLYLSMDNVIETSDIQVGSWVASKALGYGETQLEEVSVEIPKALPAGNYYIGAIADSNNAVAETDETNNSMSGAVVVVSNSPPDLIVTSLDGVPSQAGLGGRFNVSHTVINDGQTDAVAYFIYDYYYLSSDEIIDSGDTYLGYVRYRSSDGFVAGTSKTLEKSVLIPTNLTPGDYYLGVYADGYRGSSSLYKVTELDESNNTKVVPLTIVTSDIDANISSITTSQTEVLPTGQLLNLTATVNNLGTNTLVSPSVNFYLSTDTSITRDDYLVGSATTSSLAADSSRNVSLNAPVRVPAGRYYIGAMIDPENQVDEADESNNVAVGGSVDIVIGPDLVVTTVEGVPAQAGLGGRFTVNYTVANQGETAASAYYIYDYFYLSSDAMITAEDTYLGYIRYRAGDGIAAGSSKAFDRSIVIPTNLTPGDYYLGVVADGYLGSSSSYKVAEHEENNNTKAVPLTIVTNDFDANISSITTTQTEVLSTGQSLYLTATIDNTATNVLPASTINFYLSTDAIVTGDDYLLGSTGASTITAGASRNISLNAPVRVPAGRYYIGAMIDPENQVDEADESNNVATGSSADIVIGPDLLVTTVDGVPTQAGLGGRFTVNYTVANQGETTASAYYIYDYFYLSSDATITSEDTYLGYVRYRASDGVAAGSSKALERSIVIPTNLTPGDYYLGVVTDGYLGSSSSYKVAEHDENNNTKAVPLSIVTSDIDANISSITTSQTETLPTGQLLNLTATVNNLGTNTLTSPSINFYLSTDTSITSDDYLLGNVITSSVAAGASRNVSLNAPVRVPAGRYYIGAMIDPDDQVDEADESNNVAVGGSVDIVIGPDLVVTAVEGVPTQAGLGGRFTVNYTVANQGETTASAYYIYDYLYLSSDATITAEDTYLGYVRYRASDGVAASSSKALERSIVIPTNLTPGDYYLGVVTDGCKRLMIST